MGSFFRIFSAAVGWAKEHPDRRSAPSGHKLRDVPTARVDGGHAHRR